MQPSNSKATAPTKNPKLKSPANGPAEQEQSVGPMPATKNVEAIASENSPKKANISTTAR